MMGAELAGAIDVEVAGTSEAEVPEMLNAEMGAPAKLVIPRWELVDGSNSRASN